MVASTLPVHVNSASTRRWLIYRLISRIQVDVVERKRRWIGHHVDEILSHPAAGRRANQPHSKGSANFTDVAAGLGRGEQVTARKKGDLVFGRVLKLRPGGPFGALMAACPKDGTWPTRAPQDSSLAKSQAWRSPGSRRREDRRRRSRGMRFQPRRQGNERRFPSPHRR